MGVVVYRGRKAALRSLGYTEISRTISHGLALVGL
jgi:hypothetical protein